ncbi:hypothetical protein CDL15_Pgr002323 [Punica granatum]|uniref:X8 domain-containing protein n=1 Tax=Punica granatum TaxID=22663 RepID=A0A218XV93_PUNGR|nr:hypothetical protein CDL15_Pgr002323 [Punica granatum]
MMPTKQFSNLQKTWCVAKPSSDQATLLANINYACSQVDCKVIQKGCPCFYPDNLVNHASIAMNLYYQSKGRNHWNCDFRGSGLTVMTDPSKSRNSLSLCFYKINCVLLKNLLMFWPNAQAMVTASTHSWRSLVSVIAKIMLCCQSYPEEDKVNSPY